MFGKQKLLVVNLALLIMVILSTSACSDQTETAPAAPAAPVEQAAIAPTPIPVEVAKPASTATPLPTSTPTPRPTSTPVKVKTPVAAEPTASVAAPAELIETENELTGKKSVPFTATTGLDKFSTYRLNFEANFAGQRNGQPTSGELTGLLEMTRNPEAQHVQMNMAGDAFQQIAPLNNLEIYRVGGTFYMPNPQDGSWIGVPEMFVAGMLPQDAFAPEKNIDLPQTAVWQGEEKMDGLETVRYTFGPDDLGPDGANYDQVEGTIWVAKDGNYVVKYQATFTGQHKNLAAGNMKVMDEGTITINYTVSDVNDNFTIEAPAGAMGLDLTRLLFN